MRRKGGWRPGSQSQINGPDLVASARRLLSRPIDRPLGEDQRRRSFRAGSCAPFSAGVRGRRKPWRLAAGHVSPRQPFARPLAVSSGG